MDKEKLHMLIDAAWDANESQKVYEIQICYSLDAFGEPKTEITVFMNDDGRWPLIEYYAISPVYSDNNAEYGMNLIAKYKEAGLNDTV